jgi:uncharacterized protein (TIGR00725 family)
VATSSSPANPGSPDPGSADTGPPHAGPPHAGPVEIAVVGSARIQPGDPRHDAAGRLGGLLAAQGWTVVTGGYGGLMAAVSRGAAAAGGRTIGLPMAPWQHLTPDASNAELRWSNDYAQRMAFLLAASVVIALPGGIGTLAEASAVWAAAQTEPGAARLVLLGGSWKRLVAAFGAELVVDERDLAVPTVIDDVYDVIPAVQCLLNAPAQVLGAHG